MDDLFDHRTVPEYNTRAVENRTGVPADTFRAWERRYGLPCPARTEGNYRLYSDRDISIIFWLKKMTHEGLSISHAVARLHRQFEDGAPQPTNTRRRPPHADLIGLRRRLVDAFVAFDTRAAALVLDDAAPLVDTETLCLDLLQPTLVEIGDRWAKDIDSISVEHFASAFCTRRISTLFTASQPDRGDRTVVGACVQGELHEIGLMILCLLLSRSGYRVIYLGANLPTVELLSASIRIRADAIALSAATPATLDALVDAIDSLHEHADATGNPILAYGGGMFERAPEHRRRVDASYLGGDARFALRTLQDLMLSHDHRSVRGLN